MKMLITFLFILSLPLTTRAADSYLCIADMATGFAFKDGKWTTAEFDTSNKRYVIKEYPKESGEIRIVKFADEGWYVKCSEGFNKYGNLVCEQDLMIFKFNGKSLRYLLVHPHGYWVGEKPEEKVLTPFMEIGRCSLL